jgi:hypothetical protein
MERRCIASCLDGQRIARFSSGVYSIARSGSDLISEKSEDAPEGLIDHNKWFWLVI